MIWTSATRSNDIATAGPNSTDGSDSDSSVRQSGPQLFDALSNRALDRYARDAAGVRSNGPRDVMRQVASSPDNHCFVRNPFHHSIILSLRVINHRRRQTNERHARLINLIVKTFATS
jgi:hypothetical protein